MRRRSFVVATGHWIGRQAPHLNFQRLHVADQAIDLALLARHDIIQLLNGLVLKRDPRFKFGRTIAHRISLPLMGMACQRVWRYANADASAQGGTAFHSSRRCLSMLR